MLLPGLNDPAFLAIGLATTFLIALGKGAFGGGLAILGIPLLALVMDPLDAAVIVALLVSIMDMFAVSGFGRSSLSKPDLVWLLPGLVAGIGIGAAVFLLVDPKLVALGIGLITLGFTAHWFLRGRIAAPEAMPLSPAWALTAGMASGFTTFIAHAGGPPVAMYLIRRGLSKLMLAGTTVAFFTLGNLIKLPPYAAIGWHEPRLLWSALVLAPAAPLGVWIGIRLNKRLPQAQLYLACYMLLTVAALKLTWDALRALLA